MKSQSKKQDSGFVDLDTWSKVFRKLSLMKTLVSEGKDESNRALVSLILCSREEQIHNWPIPVTSVLDSEE